MFLMITSPLNACPARLGQRQFGGFNFVDKIPIRILHTEISTEKTHEDSHLLDLIRLRVKIAWISKTFFPL